MTSLTDLPLLLSGARFLAGLPAFFRRPLTTQEAAATLSRRLSRRQERFLAHTQRAVFDHPPSPYRHLFRIAGCEYGDLVRLVREAGVEGALLDLFRRGVYLTVDEFKGRRVVRRGNTAIAVTPEDLRNPRAVPHLPARTSGSRGAGTPLLFDLAFIRGCAVDTSLFLSARGGSRWTKAVWETPGAGARFRLLKYSAFGAPPARWFSQLDPDAPQLDPMFRWSERALRWGGRLAGVALPAPQYVPLADPLPLARWMRGLLDGGQIPYMFTFPSSALLLCQAAVDAGIDLAGTQFTLGGEPVTEARLNVIRRAGAAPLPRYGSMECGPIGYGCLRPDAADDVHLLHDLHALIQPDRQGEGTGQSAPLYVTSLHSRSPFIMLNVSMGDQAVMTERSCGCPFERLGWTGHLREIRSYEKLTGAGVTFMDTDVIRALEEVLPARFGGTPTDYQLLEEFGEDGRPRLRLLVHPRLGPLGEREITDTLLSRLGTGSPAARIMELLWRDLDILHVERRPPLATSSGKILHVHSATARPGAGSGRRVVGSGR